MNKMEKDLRQVWGMNQENPVENPPFFYFDPSVYLEKMQALQQKKEKKEKKNQKRKNRNVKSTFVVSGTEENYDLETILQQLGEKERKSNKNSSKK